MRYSAICYCGYETPLVDNEKDIDFGLLDAHQEFCSYYSARRKIIEHNKEEEE